MVHDSEAQTEQQLRDVHTGGVWFGMATRNPFDILGRQDDGRGAWGGWVYAVDADTGVWKWRLKSNYPIVGGVTPTAGYYNDGSRFLADIDSRRRELGFRDVDLIRCR